MSTSSTSIQPLDYLQAERFEAFKAKAQFAVRKSKWESRWTVEELSVLDQLSRLSTSDPEFDRFVETQVPKMGVDKVKTVVAKLMNVAPQLETPPVEPPPLPQSTEPAPVEMETPTIEGDADPREVLRSPGLFEAIALKAKRAIVGGKIVGTELSLANQIRACQSLIDQTTPFDQAIQSCLGPRVLEKVISDAYLESFQRRVPEMTRDRLLLETIGKLSLLELTPISSKKTGHSPTARSLSDVLRRPPVSPAHSFRRIHSVIVPAADLEEFPFELIDPLKTKMLVEGAVCIRFMFKERYSKLFPKKEERAVIHQLMLFSLMSKYTTIRRDEALRKMFGVLIEKDKKSVEAVFKKLLAKQTISKLKKVPSLTDDTPLPSVFLKPPFDSESAAEGAIQVIVYIRFVCTASYSQYPDQEKRMVDLLFNASLIRDTLHLPFSRALQLAIRDFGGIREKDVESLLVRANLGLQWEPREESQFEGAVALDTVLAAPFFTQEPFFSLFLDHVRARQSDALIPQTRAIGDLFLAVGARVKSETVPFAQLIRSSFTLNGLGRVLGVDDEAEIMERFQRAYDSLAPRLPMHKAFESEESYRELLTAAKKYRGEDRNVVRVVSSLKASEALSVRLRDIGYKNAAIFYLNRLDLRSMFNSNNDRDNDQEFRRCLSEIRYVEEDKKD